MPYEPEGLGRKEREVRRGGWSVHALAELFFKAGFHGPESGFEVDVVGDFLDDLFVGDDAVGADDEHGAAEEAEFLDGDAIGRTKGKVAVVGEGFDGVDPGGSAPAGLGEGQVAADGQDADVVGKLGGFGVETAGRMSQTGVSREGTTLMTSTLPL